MKRQVLFSLLLLLLAVWTSKAGRLNKKLRAIESKVNSIARRVANMAAQVSKINDMDAELDSILDKVEELPTKEAEGIQDGLCDIKMKIDTKCKDLTVPGVGKRKLSRDNEGYYLVFRAIAGLGKPAFERYKKSGLIMSDDKNVMLYDTVPCGCRSVNSSMYCRRHYRSMLLDIWPHLPVEKVKVTVYDKGVEKMRIIFDGKDSSFLNFFNQSRILESPYTDLVSASPNFFSIEGDNVFSRRFFISNNYNWCYGDAGWLVVVDTANPSCGWEKKYYSDYPAFLYSKDSTKVSWTAGNVGTGDVFAIWIKLGGEEECLMDL